MNLFIVKKFRDVEYKVFLPLVWLTVFILLGVSFYGLSSSGWDLNSNSFYVYCDSVGGCFNEYYDSPSCVDSVYSGTLLCTQEFIPYKSSIGVKPHFIVQYTNLIILIVVGGFLVLNTVLFNRGFFKKLKYDK